MTDSRVLKQLVGMSLILRKLLLSTLSASVIACAGSDLENESVDGDSNGASGGSLGTGGDAGGSGGTGTDGSGASVGSGGGSAAGGELASGGSGANGGNEASGGEASGGNEATGGDQGSGGEGTGGSGDPDPMPGAGKLIGFATLNGGTIGGATGEVVSVSSYADLKSYAESSERYVIMISGTISNGAGGGQIRIKSNKSLIGVGDDAFLSGVGLDMSSQNNIIVQNLRISLVGTSNPSGVNGGDNISISGTSKNIWIDHCELFSEDPSVQTNKDKYDGLLDIKGQTGFITLSWNYLHDHHKGGLVGAADDDLHDDRKVTMHHNYYNKVKLRVPMYRGSIGHFFNNYIVGAQDATEIRANTCVRVEKNYYEALHYSIYTTSDSVGKTERIDNVEVSRTSRAYPVACSADIPYDYSSVLTSNTNDVKTVVPASAGVGKL